MFKKCDTLPSCVYDAARSKCCVRSELIDSAFQHLRKDAQNAVQNDHKIQKSIKYNPR